MNKNNSTSLYNNSMISNNRQKFINVKNKVSLVQTKINHMTNVIYENELVANKIKSNDKFSNFQIPLKRSSILAEDTTTFADDSTKNKGKINKFRSSSACSNINNSDKDNLQPKSSRGKKIKIINSLINGLSTLKQLIDDEDESTPTNQMFKQMQKGFESIVYSTEKKTIVMIRKKV